MSINVIARNESDEAIRAAARREMDCFALLRFARNDAVNSSARRQHPEVSA
jgi:hypothetical protein